MVTHRHEWGSHRLEATHRVLQGRAQFDLGYRSQVLVDITAGPLTDALVVLAGPRRVGKSVILMDSVDALCRRSDIDPRQIIHIPCDQLAARDLRRVLTLGRELTLEDCPRRDSIRRRHRCGDRQSLGQGG